MVAAVLASRTLTQDFLDVVGRDGRVAGRDRLRGRDLGLELEILAPESHRLVQRHVERVTDRLHDGVPEHVAVLGDLSFLRLRNGLPVVVDPDRLVDGGGIGMPVRERRRPDRNRKTEDAGGGAS